MKRYFVIILLLFGCSEEYSESKKRKVSLVKGSYDVRIDSAMVLEINKYASTEYEFDHYKVYNEGIVYVVYPYLKKNAGDLIYFFWINESSYESIFTKESIHRVYDLNSYKLKREVNTSNSPSLMGPMGEFNKIDTEVN